jgi:hypothetical protein
MRDKRKGKKRRKKQGGKISERKGKKRWMTGGECERKGEGE